MIRIRRRAAYGRAAYGRGCATGLGWAGTAVAGQTDPSAPASRIDVESLAGAVVPDLMILFGCAFLLAAAIGLIRFPDFYTRLHATTKLVTLGGIGIFGGAAIGFAPVQATGRVLLIAVFFFLTAPLVAYMIARAGYLRGLAPLREDTSVDEWGALGSTASDLPQTDDAVPPRWGSVPRRDPNLGDPTNPEDPKREDPDRDEPSHEER